MQPDPIDDTQQDDLPSFTPMPPPMNENTDEPAAEAASEPGGDTHPVFGSNSQPQEILDEKIVGPSEPNNSNTTEPNAMNYDPENDTRLEESSQM